jgi:hypothetical protein
MQGQYLQICHDRPGHLISSVVITTAYKCSSEVKNAWRFISPTSWGSLFRESWKHAQFSFMHLQRYKRGYCTMEFHDVYKRLCLFPLEITVNYGTGWCSGDVSDLYLGSARFDVWSGNRPAWLRLFMAFLSPSRQVPREHHEYPTAISFQILFNALLLKHHPAP